MKLSTTIFWIGCLTVSSFLVCVHSWPMKSSTFVESTDGQDRITEYSNHHVSDSNKPQISLINHRYQGKVKPPCPKGYGYFAGICQPYFDFD